MKDIIIVGAGAAGMTAALYALRSGKSVLILESDSFGGQIAFSPRVENFPSIKQISGAEFSDNLLDQVMDLGAEVELEAVEKIEKSENGFKVYTNYGSYESKAVILATGVKHRKIGVEGEDELVGKGVSYCAVCDGAFYSGEEVAMIGDANTALQYSILLSNYCKKVHVCTLFDRFFGEDALVKALLSRDNVVVTHNLSLTEFLTENGELSGLVFKKTKEEGNFVLNGVKAAFIAIGQIPNNKAFADIVALDKNGYIIADESCNTSTEGIFVAGDCRTKKIRQLTTATADGAVAAVGACAYIDRS